MTRGYKYLLQKSWLNIIILIKDFLDYFCYLLILKANQNVCCRASNVSVPLWNDVEGTMATLFDLFDAEAKKCLGNNLINTLHLRDFLFSKCYCCKIFTVKYFNVPSLTFYSLILRKITPCSYKFICWQNCK